MLNWSNPNCVISQGGDADVFADSVELMVIGDLFDQRVAIVFKQDEVPHVIQKQPRTEEAANDFYATSGTTESTRQSGQIPQTEAKASLSISFWC